MSDIAGIVIFQSLIWTEISKSDCSPGKPLSWSEGILSWKKKWREWRQGRLNSFKNCLKRGKGMKRLWKSSGAVEKENKLLKSQQPCRPSFRFSKFLNKNKIFLDSCSKWREEQSRQKKMQAVCAFSSRSSNASWIPKTDRKSPKTLLNRLNTVSLNKTTRSYNKSMRALSLTCLNDYDRSRRPPSWWALVKWADWNSLNSMCWMHPQQSKDHSDTVLIEFWFDDYHF